MDLNQTQTPTSKSSFIERRHLDLVPGHTVPVNIYGRVFYCNMATAPFEMNFNDGEFFPILGRGVEWALIGDDRYTRLQFRAAVAMSLEFYGGNFAFHENVVVPVSKVAQTVIKPPPTVTILGVTGPLYSVALAPAGIVSFPGTGAAGSGLTYRKAFIVTNLSVDGDLDLLDTNPTSHFVTGPVIGGAYGIATIFPRQTNVFETSADLKLFNNTLAAIPYRIMEIFYTV